MHLTNSQFSLDNKANLDDLRSLRCEGLVLGGGPMIQKHAVTAALLLVALASLTGCASPLSAVTAVNQVKQAGTSHSNSTSPGTPQKTLSTVVQRANGPLPGDLLVADEGNSRILMMTPTKKIVWSMKLGFGGNTNAGADDAFLTPDQKHIIINEENNQLIAIIDIKSKKIVWTYGHPGVAGSKPGYLNTPDDAYQLPDGIVSVADIRNQRILFINPKTHAVVKQYGVTGQLYHNPPTSFAAPNGDTPVSGNRTLVTEIDGSYADMLSPSGHLLFSVHLPNITYPSDTQLLPNGNLLVVDYSNPGRIEEVSPSGKVVWDYYRTSGPGKLNHPSLAIALPNGDVALNDDYNDRVIIIDPHTNQIVWQYGHTGQAGASAGYLAEPDGIDFVPPGTAY